VGALAGESQCQAARANQEIAQEIVAVGIVRKLAVPTEQMANRSMMRRAVQEFKTVTGLASLSRKRRRHQGAGPATTILMRNC
jgi:hypothetical protein